MDTTEAAGGMTSNSTFKAEQLNDWARLLAGWGGLEGSAERIYSAISQLRKVVIKGKRLDDEVEGQLLNWAKYPEIEEKLSGHSTHAAIGAYGNRLAGMRKPWTASDPEVSRFRTEISKFGKPIPRPDVALIEPLRELGEIEQCGNIVTCDGIPIPIGKDQIKHFAEIRWPYARDDLLVYASNHKALTISHDCLEKLLAYSPRIHIENLTQLQRHHLVLFWAVWRRDFWAIRRALWKVTRSELEVCLVSAENLKKRDLQGQRAVNEKRIRGVLTDPAMRLKCGTAVLSEFERLYEILACLDGYRSVTRERIKEFLKNSTSIRDVLESDEPVAIYLAGTAAQVRGSYPSMNERFSSKHSDRELSEIDQIVNNTTAYKSDKPRLSKPFEGKPALYFIGIEQELIPLVAVIMLLDNLKRLEGSFRHRRKKGSNSESALENDVVRAAAIVAAHVDTRWARALLNSLSEGETDDAWLEAGMPGKPESKPKEDAPRKLEEIERPFVGDRNHTRLYTRARERIEQLPKVFQPGWTRGFFFEAWLQHNPEASFLKKCATWQKFSKKGLKAHEQRMKNTMSDPIPGFTGSAETTFTRLPKENPVETQHNRMKPFIDQIQGPDKIGERFRKWFYRERDLIIAEVAYQFPAVTSVTLDSYLHEQITNRIDERVRKFVVEGAWYTTLNPSSREP